MRTRLTGPALLGCLAIIAAACGGGGATTRPSVAAPSAPASPGGEGLKIGVVTDVGQLEDKSFNQFSNQGAVDAAQQLGGEHRVIVTEEISDYQANIQALVDEDFDVIVTIGFLIGTDTLNAAKENEDVTFIGVDQGICVDEEGNADPDFTCAGDAAALIPNYQGILFAEAQPGYLAGIVAASISESGVIGAIGGTDVPAVVAYRDGYINGAKSVDPEIEVLYQQTDPDPAKGFNDPARGKQLAEQMIDQDADVLFQIAGLTGQGVLEAACDNEIHGIGVDVDQAQSIPQLAPCIVTSAEKKLQDTVKAVILSVDDGSFQAGEVRYDASSDPPAIGLSSFSDAVPEEVQTLVDEAFQGFVDGTLDPLASPAP